RAIIDFGKNAAAWLNLTTKKPQIFFGHEWYVDSKCQQVFGVHPRQDCPKRAARAARWRIVCDKLQVSRAPEGIGACGKKDFYPRQFSQQRELSLPERFAVKQKRRFVLAHPA